MGQSILGPCIGFCSLLALSRGWPQQCMILQLASSDREKARTTMGHRVRQRESELEPEGEREGENLLDGNLGSVTFVLLGHNYQEGGFCWEAFQKLPNTFFHADPKNSCRFLMQKTFTSSQTPTKFCPITFCQSSQPHYLNHIQV